RPLPRPPLHRRAAAAGPGRAPAAHRDHQSCPAPGGWPAGLPALRGAPRQRHQGAAGAAVSFTFWPARCPLGMPRTALALLTLLGWLNAGAPAGGDACTPAPDAGAPPSAPPSGPGALPCTPKHEFRAHGAGPTDPYPVPVEANAYRCFTFPVPFGAGEQATAWAPIIDDAR